MAAILIAGWLILFADDAAHCQPAQHMRAWLTDEGFSLDHPHTGLDGRRYEFWVQRESRRAYLVQLNPDGTACVADEGFLHRGGRYHDSLPLAQ